MQHNLYLNPYASSAPSSSSCLGGYPLQPLSKPHYGQNYYGPYQYIPAPASCFSSTIQVPLPCTNPATPIVIQPTQDPYDAPASLFRLSNPELSPTALVKGLIPSPEKHPYNQEITSHSGGLSSGPSFDSAFPTWRWHHEDLVGYSLFDSLNFSPTGQRTESSTGFGQKSPSASCNSRKELKRKPRRHCQLCNKSYISSASLRHHLKAVHGGDKDKLVCHICTKSFFSPSTLTKHMRIHNNEKPYECTTCERRFTDRSTYRKHLVTHTGESPFPCDHCSSRFTQKGNLTRHIRQKHTN